MMVWAILAIGCLSFVVWAHHMYVSGMNPYFGFFFATTTLIIAVPTAIKVYNWVLTIWRGDVHLTVPMLFAIGFIFTFINGGLTGLFLGNVTVDVPLSGTYFVVAHFHMVMGVSPILVVFGAIYHWYPKITGRMLDERLGKIHFWCTFLGTYAIYLPMHYLGILGVPRRYYAYSDAIEFIPPVGACRERVDLDLGDVRRGRAAGVPVQPGLVVLQNGRAAGPNPWRATSLEWQTPDTPPKHGNWGKDLPVVHRWAVRLQRARRAGGLHSAERAARRSAREAPAGRDARSAHSESDRRLRRARDRHRRLADAGQQAACEVVGSAAGVPATRAPRRRDCAPARVGLWVFLAVVTSLFGLFISAYYMRMGHGHDGTGAGTDWAPLSEPAILWLNTLLLIVGSVAMQCGARARCAWQRRAQPHAHCLLARAADARVSRRPVLCVAPAARLRSSSRRRIRPSRSSTCSPPCTACTCSAGCVVWATHAGAHRRARRRVDRRAPERRAVHGLLALLVARVAGLVRRAVVHLRRDSSVMIDEVTNRSSRRMPASPEGLTRRDRGLVRRQAGLPRAVGQGDDVDFPAQRHFHLLVLPDVVHERAHVDDRAVAESRARCSR